MMGKSAAGLGTVAAGATSAFLGTTTGSAGFWSGPATAANPPNNRTFSKNFLLIRPPVFDLICARKFVMTRYLAEGAGWGASDFLNPPHRFPPNPVTMLGVPIAINRPPAPNGVKKQRLAAQE